MAKKKDPAVAVVRYFETADLGQASLVLSLAKDAIARRKPTKMEAKPQSTSTTGSSTTGVSITSSRRARTSRTAAGQAAAGPTAAPPPPALPGV